MSVKPEMKREGRGENHKEASDCNKAEKEVGVCMQDGKSPVIDLTTYSSKSPEGQNIWTVAGGVTLYETDRYERVLLNC